MFPHGASRRWTASEKQRIVLARMKTGVEGSDLCCRAGLYAVQSDAWKN